MRRYSPSQLPSEGPTRANKQCWSCDSECGLVQMDHGPKTAAPPVVSPGCRPQPTSIGALSVPLSRCPSEPNLEGPVLRRGCWVKGRLCRLGRPTFCLEVNFW